MVYVQHPPDNIQDVSVTILLGDKPAAQHELLRHSGPLGIGGGFDGVRLHFTHGIVTTAPFEYRWKLKV